MKLDDSHVIWMASRVLESEQNRGVMAIFANSPQYLALLNSKEKPVRLIYTATYNPRVHERSDLFEPVAFKWVRHTGTQNHKQILRTCTWRFYVSQHSVPYRIPTFKLRELHTFLDNFIDSKAPKVHRLPQEEISGMTNTISNALSKFNNAKFFIYNSCFTARPIDAFNVRRAAQEVPLYVGRDVSGKLSGVSFANAMSNHVEGVVFANTYYYGVPHLHPWLAHVKAFVGDLLTRPSDVSDRTDIIFHFPIAIDPDTAEKLLEPWLGRKHSYPPSSVGCVLIEKPKPVAAKL